MPGQVAEINRSHEIGNRKPNGSHIEGDSRKNAGNKPKPKSKPQGTGFIAGKLAYEMDRNRHGYYDSMLGGSESSEFDLKNQPQKEKEQKPLLHEQPKQREKRRNRNSWDMER